MPDEELSQLRNAFDKLSAKADEKENIDLIINYLKTGKTGTFKYTPVLYAFEEDYLSRLTLAWFLFPEYKTLMRALPAELIANIFNYYISKALLNFDRIDTETLRYLTYDNPDLPVYQRVPYNDHLLYSKLCLNGDIEAAKKSATDYSSYGLFVHALLVPYEGRYVGAIKLFYK